MNDERKIFRISGGIIPIECLESYIFLNPNLCSRKIPNIMKIISTLRFPRRRYMESKYLLYMY